MTDRELLLIALGADLSCFVQKVFEAVSAGDEYRHNWHIEAITHELQRIHSGENRRLLITQPPRSLKSICSSVAYPAWALGHNPNLRFACVSYSNDLALQFSRQFRRVVTSDWYRAVFPAVRLPRDTDSECTTAQGGGRMALSIGGTVTGRGFDIIVVDDPMKAEDALSEKVRAAVIEWYGSTLITRLNDKATGRIVVVMQRLHEDDLAGHLLAQGRWHHLDLPAIAICDQEIAIGPGKVHLRKAGEVLHPERESLEVLEGMKRSMGSLTFSAQYQQSPIPAEGNLVRREWLRWYDQLPQVNGRYQIVQSWDVAVSGGPQNDWSVCTTWLIDKQTYYLVDVWRDRLNFPAIRKKVIELARLHQAGTILVERDGPGRPLVQLLQDDAAPGVPTPLAVKVVGDKAVRLQGQSARFESGQVVLPRKAPWLDVFLKELLGFPTARHDDQVDSVSQFLIWAERHYAHSTQTIAGPILYQDGRRISP